MSELFLQTLVTVLFAIVYIYVKYKSVEWYRCQKIRRLSEQMRKFSSYVFLDITSTQINTYSPASQIICCNHFWDVQSFIIDPSVITIIDRPWQAIYFNKRIYYSDNFSREVTYFEKGYLSGLVHIRCKEITLHFVTDKHWSQ